jgi:hypothetical protein
MKKIKQYFTKSTIIISLISLAVGFTGGFIFQKSRSPFFNGKIANGNFTPQMNGVGPQNSANGNRRGNGNTTQTSNLKQNIGEITKIDDTSLTIKTMDGGSKIILISDSTVINKATQGSKSDLKTGLKISIIGDSNTDGSITSKTININSENTPPEATAPTQN